MGRFYVLSMATLCFISIDTCKDMPRANQGVHSVYALLITYLVPSRLFGPRHSSQFSANTVEGHEVPDTSLLLHTIDPTITSITAITIMIGIIDRLLKHAKKSLYTNSTLQSLP